MSVPLDVSSPSSTPQRSVCCIWVGCSGAFGGASQRGDGLFRRLEELAEACLRFTPKVAIRAGEAVFLDLGLHLGAELGPDPEARRRSEVQARVRALCRRFQGAGASPGTSPGAFGGFRIGFAGHPAEALSRARLGWSEDQLPWERLPLEVLLDYATPFQKPEPELSAEWDRMIATLRLLGLRTLGEFIRLPSASLASRLGREAERLSRCVRERVQPTWPVFRPVEKVAEKIDLSFDPCFDLEAVFFVVKGLADRAMARLRGRCERASAVELWLGYRAGRRVWEVDLPVPQGTAVGLLPILRERVRLDLERASRGDALLGDAPLGDTPFGDTVEELRLTILETVPGRGSQRNFFHRQDEDSEAWESLIGRLSSKMGKERVFWAAPVDRYLPERNWQAVPAAIRAAEEGFSPVLLDIKRPARLLEKPEPLRRQGETLISANGRQRWHAIHWDGPERISGEWWEEGGFHRDYYRIIVETGEQLWVFASASGGACDDASRLGPLYLHGYFD